MALKFPVNLAPINSQVNNPDINGGGITPALIDGGSDPVGLLFDSTPTTGGLWIYRKGSFDNLVLNLIFQTTDILQVSGTFTMSAEIKKIPPNTNKSTLTYDTANVTAGITIPAGSYIKTFNASINLTNVNGIVKDDLFYYRLTLTAASGWAGKVLLIHQQIDGNLI